MEASLRNRLTFGPLMLAALLGDLFLDHYIEARTGYKGVGIAALLIIVLPLGVLEITNLFTPKHATPFRSIAIPATAALLLHGFLTQFPKFQHIAASTFAFIIVGTMFFAALRLAAIKQINDAIGVMAGTVLATLYLGGLGWFLIALRVKVGIPTEAGGGGFVGSTMHVVMILLTVKFTDIGAFFGGKALGKHKLIPWLSPGKTWEGLVCGVLTAGAVGALCATQIVHLSWPKGFLFGLIIGAVGQMGDLLESLMKRDAQVKDSGQTIPGFGGILDVTDSPLLAAPFAYLLFSLF